MDIIGVEEIVLFDWVAMLATEENAGSNSPSVKKGSWKNEKQGKWEVMPSQHRDIKDSSCALWSPVRQ